MWLSRCPQTEFQDESVCSWWQAVGDGSQSSRIKGRDHAEVGHCNPKFTGGQGRLLANPGAIHWEGRQWVTAWD